jgi:glycerol-3-phosphate dehydrogenase
VVRANSPAQVRLVKGSHIVLRRLFDHDRAYIFQNADGRIVFAIPYEGDYTLVGTTDVDHHGDPGDPGIAEGEITYLLTVVREYFRVPAERSAIVWTYSGVRPLYDDGASSAQEATRDYVLELDAPEGRAPLLSVFGGKITTYRRLAEQALDQLGKHLEVGRRWTAKAALPGGDFPVDGVGDLVRSLGNAYPFLGEAHLRRLVRAYGTRTAQLMNGAKSYADLGRRFGADLTEAEVAYLVSDEWAATADDILWRRSKLGLRTTAAERTELQDYLDTARSKPRLAAAGAKP